MSSLRITNLRCEYDHNPRGIDVARASAGSSLAVPGIIAQWGGQASHHVYTTSGGPACSAAGWASPLDYIINEIAAISWRGVGMATTQPDESAVVIVQGLIGALSAA